ncbi:MAG: hypothetical protein P8Y00_03950, partial [Deltaproteobacteria bacterium]
LKRQTGILPEKNGKEPEYALFSHEGPGFGKEEFDVVCKETLQRSEIMVVGCVKKSSYRCFESHFERFRLESKGLDAGIRPL